MRLVGRRSMKGCFVILVLSVLQSRIEFELQRTKCVCWIERALSQSQKCTVIPLRMQLFACIVVHGSLF